MKAQYKTPKSKRTGNLKRYYRKLSGFQLDRLTERHELILKTLKEVKEEKHE